MLFWKVQNIVYNSYGKTLSEKGAFVFKWYDEFVFYIFIFVNTQHNSSVSTGLKILFDTSYQQKYNHSYE